MRKVKFPGMNSVLENPGFAVYLLTENRRILMSDDRKDESPPYFPMVEDSSTLLRQRQFSLNAVIEPVTLSAFVSTASITVSSLIIPERKTAEGILVRSTSAIWLEIVQRLGSDWTLAFQLNPDQWEELVAGAFHKAGYDEVTKTPRSGDHGRDLIAVKHGFGCVKILGSVKAYKADHPVEYDAVRALVGVLTADPKASKGIITTTSDFPPQMENDPSIAPFLPTRLVSLSG
jgi:restriction system protein